MDPSGTIVALESILIIGLAILIGYLECLCVMVTEYLYFNYPAVSSFLQTHSRGMLCTALRRGLSARKARHLGSEGPPKDSKD